jgi:hypothetical protein
MIYWGVEAILNLSTVEVNGQLYVLGHSSFTLRIGVCVAPRRFGIEKNFHLSGIEFHHSSP